MSNWQNKLDIKDSWKLSLSGEMSRHSLSAEIADKLKVLSRSMDDSDIEERDCLVDEFVALSEDHNSTIDDFDDALDRLYDWGDTTVGDVKRWPRKALCWIATEF